MSYEILYNRLFLKTKEGKVIPIILSGSNNCYEVTWKGQRRDRSWSVCNGFHWCNHKIDCTREELLKEFEKWLNHDEMYKVNGKYINGRQWYNLINKAFNEAITVEELKPHEKPNAFLSIWGRPGEGEPADQTMTEKIRINTSEELQDFINMYNERVNNKSENESIYPRIVFPVEKFEHQKRGKKEQKERLKEFYVVVIDKGYSKYYVKQLTARRLSYSYDANYAKQFTTEKEAQKWVNEKSINTRFTVNCLIEKVS